MGSDGDGDAAVPSGSRGRAADDVQMDDGCNSTTKQRTATTEDAESESKADGIADPKKTEKTKQKR